MVKTLIEMGAKRSIKAIQCFIGRFAPPNEWSVYQFWISYLLLRRNGSRKAIESAAAGVYFELKENTIKIKKSYWNCCCCSSFWVKRQQLGTLLTILLPDESVFTHNFVFRAYYFWSRVKCKKQNNGEETKQWFTVDNILRKLLHLLLLQCFFWAKKQESLLAFLSRNVTVNCCNTHMTKSWSTKQIENFWYQPTKQQQNRFQQQHNAL